MRKRNRYKLPAWIWLAVMPSKSERQTIDEKSFPDLGCAWSLPSLEWHWSEGLLPHTACMSHRDAGLVTLDADPCSEDLRVDREFASASEARFLQEGREKIASRILTFCNVPCYEFEYKLPDGGIAFQRQFISHGVYHTLHFLGSPNLPQPRRRAECAFETFRLVAKKETSEES